MNYKEEKIMDTKVEDIDSLIEQQGDISPIILKTPDYSYGASQEPLNASYQIRNLNGGKIKTGYSIIPSGYTPTAITGIGFKPKAIQVTVRSGTKAAWGYADDVGGTLTQRCIYDNTGSYGAQNNRLFRFSSTEVGILNSLDTDGFTVSSDISAIMIWTCFG